MNKRKLFTLILEHVGGTYISQVSAISPSAALLEWVAKVSSKELHVWKITRSELRTMAEDEPISITGCPGVWCIAGSTRKGLALVNIVATER
jgi:hypothetical protein